MNPERSRALRTLTDRLIEAERLVRERRRHRDPTDPIGSACLIAEAEGRRDALRGVYQAMSERIER